MKSFVVSAISRSSLFGEYAFYKKGKTRNNRNMRGGADTMKARLIPPICLCCFVIAGCALQRAQPDGNSTPADDPAEMVFIAGGNFIMGSENGDDDEIPVHEVFVKPFYLDVHEVTNRQYVRFLEQTGHPPPDFWHPDLDDSEEPVIRPS